MAERLGVQPPRLSEAQRLWLIELGLDRPNLARFTPKKAAGSVPAPRGSALSTAPDLAQADSKASQTLAASTALSALRSTREPAGLKRVHAALGQISRPATPDLQEAPQVGAASDWASLEARIHACEACGLHAERHKAVPGAGATEQVDWLVVGEAPGARDDGLGEPFQGKAGELLHAMLEAAGIDSQHKVFYTNLVKCRPRSSRPPSSDEIAACQTHLRTQVALLRPRGILALGRLAAQALVADGKPFEEQRGRVHAFQVEGGQSIALVVTYHPASLLSRPKHKAASWRDLNLALGF